MQTTTTASASYTVRLTVPLLGDHLGSTTTSVNAATGATQTQRFLPYGAPRSGSISATDRGWIGQTKDASTGLQYLNARYYDPTIGRFAAVDPIVDTERPISLDRYGYGDASPVTNSDPMGLRPLECDQGWDCTADSNGTWTVSNPPPPPKPPKPPTPPTPPKPDPTSSGWDEGLTDAEKAEVVREYLEDQLGDGGLDLIGSCAQGQAVKFFGIQGSVCDVTVDGERGLTLTGGLLAGSEGLTAGAGALTSNADELDDLDGSSFCASLGGSGVLYGGGGTGCLSTSGSTITLYAGVEIGTGAPGKTASGGYFSTQIVHDPYAFVTDRYESWWHRTWGSLVCFHRCGGG